MQSCPLFSSQIEYLLVPPWNILLPIWTTMFCTDSAVVTYSQPLGRRALVLLSGYQPQYDGEAPVLCASQARTTSECA